MGFFDYKKMQNVNRQLFLLYVICTRNKYTKQMTTQVLIRTYVMQHVQDAAISGFVHSLVGGDEHSQGAWTSQWRGWPTVLQTHKHIVSEQSWGFSIDSYLALVQTYLTFDIPQSLLVRLFAFSHTHTVYIHKHTYIQVCSLQWWQISPSNFLLVFETMSPLFPDRT